MELDYPRYDHVRAERCRCDERNGCLDSFHYAGIGTPTSFQGMIYKNPSHGGVCLIKLSSGQEALFDVFL